MTKFEKWMAADPAVGDDGNSGEDGHPWRSFQSSIDRLVDQRKTPTDTFVLHIMNYQVNDAVVLAGARYDNLTIIGVMGPGARQDPSDPVFCEGRPLLISKTKPTYQVITVNDVKNFSLQDLHLSASGGALSAGKVKTLEIVGCCIDEHTHSLAWGGGFIKDCYSVKVDRCRVTSNTSPKNGGGLLIEDCNGVRVLNSVFCANRAADAGGALFIHLCKPAQVALLGNKFVALQGLAANKATFGGAVAVGDAHDVLIGGLGKEQNTFSDNHATADGGAVHLELAPLVHINGDHYRHNMADGGGGAIFSHGCDVWLANVDFEGNSAARGGGVAAEINDNIQRPGSIDVTECLFHGNEATVVGGGGLNVQTAVAVITLGRFFDHNKARQDGGAICFCAASTVPSTGNRYAGTLAVNLTQISDNQATRNGGGIAYNGDQGSDCTLSVKGCALQGNTAVEDGGAVSIQGAAGNAFTGNTITKNEAKRAAGLHLDNDNVGALTVTNNEFADNPLSGSAPGLRKTLQDIFVIADKGVPKVSAAHLERDNTVGGKKPFVVVK